MSIVMNLYYFGKNGSARAFADEMENSGLADLIRASVKHDIRQQYFVPKNPHPHTKYHDKCH